MHGSQKRFCLDPIEPSQIRVEHDPLSAQEHDCALNSLGRNQFDLGHGGSMLGRLAPEKISSLRPNLEAPNWYLKIGNAGFDSS